MKGVRLQMRWKRLDLQGSDRCELAPAAEGWALGGVAEFGEGPAATHLSYRVIADREWRTQAGRVRGTIGGRAIGLDIERATDGTWRVDGVASPALTGLVDLDLGFTPATNLFPLRRLGLQVGEGADAAAAWLDEKRWKLVRLPQRYERRDASHYWYESPSSGYAGMLTVTADGFVSDYPGLWCATTDLPARD
jgi:hypothetical protein